MHCLSESWHCCHPPALYPSESCGRGEIIKHIERCLMLLPSVPSGLSLLASCSWAGGQPMPALPLGSLGRSVSRLLGQMTHTIIACFIKEMQWLDLTQRLCAGAYERWWRLIEQPDGGPGNKQTPSDRGRRNEERKNERCHKWNPILLNISFCVYICVSYLTGHLQVAVVSPLRTSMWDQVHACSRRHQLWSRHGEQTLERIPAVSTTIFCLPVVLTDVLFNIMHIFRLNGLIWACLVCFIISLKWDRICKKQDWSDYLNTDLQCSIILCSHSDIHYRSKVFEHHNPTI